METEYDLGFFNPPLHFLRPWHEVPRHIRIVLLLYLPSNLYIAGLGFLRQWFFDASICRILQINSKTQVREIILNQIKKHTVVASEYYHAGLIMHFNLFNSNCILQNSHRWLIWWGSHFGTTGVSSNLAKQFRGFVQLCFILAILFVLCNKSDA